MARRVLLNFEKAGSEWIAWHRQIAWLLKQEASGRWAVYRLRNGEKAWSRVLSDTTYDTDKAAGIAACDLAAQGKR